MKKLISLCLFLLVGVCASAGAVDKVPLQTPSVVALAARYPSGSITTNDIAERALGETARERANLEIRYIQDQRTCYGKFFVSSCLTDAKDIYSSEKKAIRDIDTEANARQRQFTVDERDRALEEQGKADAADAADRMRQQKEHAAASASKQAENAQKARDDAAKQAQPQVSIDQRVAEHEARMQQIRAREASEAAERAANVRDYDQKVKDAAAHRKEVEANKAVRAKEVEAHRQELLEQQKADAAKAAPLVPAK